MITITPVNCFPPGSPAKTGQWLTSEARRTLSPEPFSTGIQTKMVLYIRKNHPIDDRKRLKLYLLCLMALVMERERAPLTTAVFSLDSGSPLIV